jgi:hypothetical protein
MTVWLWLLHLQSFSSFLKLMLQFCVVFKRKSFCKFLLFWLLVTGVITWLCTQELVFEVFMWILHLLCNVHNVAEKLPLISPSVGRNYTYRIRLFKISRHIQKLVNCMKSLSVLKLFFIKWRETWWIWLLNSNLRLSYCRLAEKKFNLSICGNVAICKLWWLWSYDILIEWSYKVFWHSNHI